MHANFLQFINMYFHWEYNFCLLIIESKYEQSTFFLNIQAETKKSRKNKGIQEVNQTDMRRLDRLLPLSSRNV